MEDKPKLLADVLSNLANDYVALRRTDSINYEENHEKAIAADLRALKILQGINEARAAAKVKHNLAYLYIDRTSGVRIDNLKLAVEYNRSELAVLTPDSQDSYLLAVESLAEALDKLGEINEAKVYHEQAIEAFDKLVGSGFNSLSLRNYIEQYGSIFGAAAWNAYLRHDISSAFYFSERGRARLLDVALRLQARINGLPERTRATVVALRNELSVVEAKRADLLGANDLIADSTRVAQHADAIREKIQAILPIDKPREVAKPSPLPGTAVVMPLVSDAGIVLLIATDQGYSAKALNLDRLRTVFHGNTSWGKTYDLLRKTLREGNDLRSVEDGTPAFSERYTELRSQLEDLSRRLWLELGAPLKEELEQARRLKRKPGFGSFQRRPFAVIPFWMAQNPDTKETLLDQYEFSLAFSLSEISLPKGIHQNRSEEKLAAWFNIQARDLPYTKAESLMVPIAFSSTRSSVLSDAEFDTADRALSNLAGSQVWHLSTHGASNKDPTEAYLEIAGVDEAGKPRTLRVEDVFGGIFPSPPEMVVLSACESGIPDLSEHEEFLGFPSALVTRGAKGVVSSLWPVPDDSTAALLFAKFLSTIRPRRRWGYGIAFRATLAKGLNLPGTFNVRLDIFPLGRPRCCQAETWTIARAAKRTIDRHEALS